MRCSVQQLDGFIDLLVEAVLRDMVSPENEKPACADLAGGAEAGEVRHEELYGSKADT